MTGKIYGKKPGFSLNKDWTIGWKLIDKNKIVGTCLNIPFIFEHNNKQILAAVCNNYVIDKKYRSYSLRLRHLFLNQKILICLLPIQLIKSGKNNGSI